MCNPAIKSAAMVMALMASVWATGAPFYEFAAGFNGTLTPDVQPAGSAAPVVVGTGAAVNSSTYKYGTGSLLVQSTPTGEIKYDWSQVPMTSVGTIGLWYNPSYTPSAATGTNVLFQALEKNPGAWTSAVTLSRVDNNLRLSINWDNDYNFDSVLANISGWAAGDWHYIECQWANPGFTYLSIYVDGTRAGTFNLTYKQNLTRTMEFMSIGGNGAGTYFANGYIDGFWYDNVANPTSLTCTVPTSDVPEPAMAVFLALGGLVVLRRRQ